MTLMPACHPIAGAALLALAACSSEPPPGSGAVDPEPAVPEECALAEPYLGDLKAGISMLHRSTGSLGDQERFDRLGDALIGIASDLEDTDFTDVSEDARELVARMGSVSMGTSASSQADRLSFAIAAGVVLAALEGVRCDPELAKRREAEQRQRQEAEDRRREFLQD